MRRNEYQSKFFSMKNLCEELVEEISRLPDNLQYKFKRCSFLFYLVIVKIKKLSGSQLECLRSHSGNKYHKPSRLSSKGSSANSRSKDKPLKMEDLNTSSRHS